MRAIGTVLVYVSRVPLRQDLTRELRGGSLIDPSESDDRLQFHVFLEVIQILFCLQVLGDPLSSSHGGAIRRDAHCAQIVVAGEAKRGEEGISDAMP